MMIDTVRKNSRPILSVLFLAVTLVGSLGPLNVVAQNPGLVMTGTRIQIELLANGTSRISFRANATNRGAQALDYIDIRFDARSLNVFRSVIDGNAAISEKIGTDNYILIRMQTAESLLPGQSSVVEIEMTTDTLQETIGFCEEDTGCVMHAIYYFRPLNEIQNLTVSLSLPVHATLQETAALPVFPRPHTNHTDGYRMIFSWSVSSLLPGQERVYIARYVLPTSPAAVAETDSILIPSILAAALVGALIALGVERAPRLVRNLRETRIVNHGVTQHEEQILRLLSRKDGKCFQHEIYEELEMSQSLASMVLTGMEERGLVKRFREGRKNVVHLIEQ